MIVESIIQNRFKLLKSKTVEGIKSSTVFFFAVDIILFSDYIKTNPVSRPPAKPEICSKAVTVPLRFVY